MITGARYNEERGEVVLLQGGKEEAIPFTPRLLIPNHLAPHLPHHLPTYPAPGGLYVEAPHTTLLRLYHRLKHLSPAIIYPSPVRQFFLIEGVKPFSYGLQPYLPTLESAFFHLLGDPSPLSPARIFLENVLFLHGYARPLKRISRYLLDESVYYPFFHFNTEDSVLSEEGDIVLPSSPARVSYVGELYSLHPDLGRVVVKGSAVLPLADALLYDLEVESIREVRSKSEPSFIHREVSSLISVFVSSLRAPFSDLDGDATPFNLLVAVSSVLYSLPYYLANTYVLGRWGRSALLVGYNLLHRDPNLYNLLAGENDTCCQGLKELASYRPVLSSLLTEHHPSLTYLKGLLTHMR